MLIITILYFIYIFDYQHINTLKLVLILLEVYFQRYQH